MSPLSSLRGARLQRIDGPRPDLFALTFHGRDLHGVLLLRVERDRTAEWAWVSERPRGDPASAYVRLLRKHLENARLTELTIDARGATLDFVRGEVASQLRVSARPANLSLVVGGVHAGARHRPAEEQPAALIERGEALARSVFEGERERARRELAQLAARRRRSLRRRLEAIEGDLARLEEVPGLRSRASLLLAHLHQVPQGARAAEVTDWNADPPAPLRIPIAEGRSAREEADALFKRARKLERGAEIALGRHADTERAIEALEQIAHAVESADEEALPGLRAELARLGARRQRGPAGADATRRPYREFRGSGGGRIRVGRSARDNDALTLHHARPWDLWLHVRGAPGSHVVVPLERGHPCPAELLVDAAHLAVHYSGARGEDRTEVQYLERRHLQKPRGAAPGAVTLRGEKVIAVRLEPERLAALLRTEA